MPPATGDLLLKQLVAVIDSRTTVICLHAAGQIQPVDQPFDTLAGEFDDPPFHVHCRSMSAPWMPGFVTDIRAESNQELLRRPLKTRRIGPDGEVGGYLPPPPNDLAPTAGAAAVAPTVIPGADAPLVLDEHAIRQVERRADADGVLQVSQVLRTPVRGGLRDRLESLSIAEITARAEPEQVDLSDVIPVQRTVDVDRLLALTGAGDRYARRYGAESDPMLLVRYRGELYLLDGTHRAVAAVLSDVHVVTAMVADL